MTRTKKFGDCKTKLYVINAENDRTDFGTTNFSAELFNWVVNRYTDKYISKGVVVKLSPEDVKVLLKASSRWHGSVHKIITEIWGYYYLHDVTSVYFSTV
jgi:hypothetical protein